MRSLAWQAGSHGSLLALACLTALIGEDSGSRVELDEATSFHAREDVLALVVDAQGH
jgi:hypothetical protein